MDTRKTLLFLVTTANYFLSHRLNLALDAQEAGFQVLVATAPGEKVDDVLKHGFTHFAVPFDRKSINPFTELQTLLAVARLYRKVRPDIVHHIALKPTLYGGIAARLAGLDAVVATIAGLGYAFSGDSLLQKILRIIVQGLVTLAYRESKDVFVFQNPDDAQDLMKLWRNRARNTMVIPGTGVDTKKFVPVKTGPQEETVFVLPARMLWDKGVAEFCEAARGLIAKGPGTRFLLAGGTDFDNRAAVPMSFLEGLKKEDRLAWLGHVKDMRALLDTVDVVVLPTKYREGIPMALLEGAACGKALVTTDVPGCREVVRNGVNGFLVPQGDADALATVMGMLAEDPSLRKTIGQEARRQAETVFDRHVINAQYITLYRDLLERGGKARMVIRSPA